jgi:hypothetical protein
MADPSGGQGAQDGTGLRNLSWASVTLWALLLPFTQAEQRLRTRVEQAFKDGRITDALAEMSAHSQDEFPPQWEPPPRLAYGDEGPSLLELMEAIAEDPPAPWVRSLYVQRFSNYLFAAFGPFPQDPQTRSLPPFHRVLDLLQRLPEGPALIAEHREDLERFVGHRWIEQPDVHARLRMILGIEEQAQD